MPGVSDAVDRAAVGKIYPAPREAAPLDRPLALWPLRLRRTAPKPEMESTFVTTLCYLYSEGMA